MSENYIIVVIINSWIIMNKEAAVTHNEINESIATVKKLACLFH